MQFQRLCLRWLHCVVVLPLLLTMGACEIDVAPDEEGLGSVQQPGWGPNGLLGDHVLLNGLTTNHNASKHMLTVPLATASYADSLPEGSPLKYQLRHEGTRRVMSYIVGCALGSGQEVEYTNSGVKAWPTSPTYTFQGDMGLCKSWGETGGTASKVCQELVSACVLARVNALGATVQVSMRGDRDADNLLGDAPRLQLQSTVRTGTEKVSPEGTIDSFRPCTDAAAAFSAAQTRNCGWTADYVGKCAPGSWVNVGAGGRPPVSGCWTYPALGSSTGDTILRVCGGSEEGVHGCDNGSASLLAQSDNSCWTSYPYVGFKCPASGFFSVMSAAKNITSTSVTATPAASGTSVYYPATEAQVFPVKEGGFYGNLWATDATGRLMIRYPAPGSIVDSTGTIKLSSAAIVVDRDPSIYEEMWACHDRGWTDGFARLTKRLCASPAFTVSGCAARLAGTCVSSDSSKSKCSAEDDTGTANTYADYPACIGATSIVYRDPITVYLNRACDLVSYPGMDDVAWDPNTCARTETTTITRTTTTL